MKKIELGTGRLIVAGLLLWAGGARAYEAPFAVKQIPADAAWVVLLDKPGDSVTRGTTVIAKFKDLHPDLDPTKWSAKIKAELGVDLLTPAGMEALGIDPKGTIAIWSNDFQADPHLALPLVDADRFIQKMGEIYQRKAGKPAGPPTQKAGVKMVELGGDRFAIKGRWAVLLEPDRPGSDRTDASRAFFGRGNKLAGQRVFKTVCKQLPEDLDGLVYLSMSAIKQAWKKQIGQDISSQSKRLEKATSPKSREWMQGQLTAMRRVEKQFSGWLGQFDGLAAGYKLDDKAVEWTLIASITAKGNKALSRMLPAGATAPAFHAGLLQASLMGGWASLRVPAFLDWVSDLPEAPWRTFGDDLAEADKGFREEFQQGLLADVLGNLREPVAAYLLAPDLKDLNPDAPANVQALQMIRFLAVARVADRDKAEQFLAKLTDKAKAKAEGRTLSQKQVNGAQVTTFVPEPGLELDWGLKGDVLMFGVGHDAVTPAARLIDAGSFRLARASADRGLAQIDFAAVGETMSSAVARGIGGKNGTQFRMTWPLVQQVLGRFDKLVFSGELSASGLRIKAVLGMR